MKERVVDGDERMAWRMEDDRGVVEEEEVVIGDERKEVNACRAAGAM